MFYFIFVMKQFTLGFIINPTWKNVLLWCKKNTNSGFTVALQKRNGPWWSVDNWESIEDGMIREIFEEAKIEISKTLLMKRWFIKFSFIDKPEWDRECTIFIIPWYSWLFEETEEMRRQWRPISDLPRDNMRPSDKIWLEKLLEWKYINAEVVHNKEWKLLNIKFD